MFKVIPVIDLLEGQVVHARRGDRANYRPIESPLCAGAAPNAVVAGLRSVYRFPVFYIADLGAITGTGNDHLREVHQLTETFPDVTWWVDAGFSDRESLQKWRHPRIKPVAGTESINDVQVLDKANWPLVLSLDGKNGDTIDELAIHDQPALWPPDVIVMTLDKVGSGAGPAFGQLSNARARHPGGRIFAAGGVRNDADLKNLKNRGIAGALVATALHNSTLTGPQIERISANSTEQPGKRTG